MKLLKYRVLERGYNYWLVELLFEDGRSLIKAYNDRNLPDFVEG